MTQFAERSQVAPRTAAKIENREWRRSRYVPQQRVNILTHIMIAGPGAEILGTLLIMCQRRVDEMFQFLRWDRLAGHCVISRVSKLVSSYAEDKIGGLFSNHDRGSIRIATDDAWHDRRIHYPQSREPVDAQ